MEFPLFIAEISSNHAIDNACEGDGGFDRVRAHQLIECAASCGVTAVKFQLFRMDQLFSPEILANSADHRRRQTWQVPPDEIASLAKHAHTHGLLFSCTPFDLEAVEVIAPHVDFFKIASYELLWHPLLAACAKHQKPIWLSTGMANQQEVEAALHAYETLPNSADHPLNLMHCVSVYPTATEACNLSAIQTLQSLTKGQVGWSDHTREPAILLTAILRHGAKAIEFHLDLDQKGAEFGAGHCWLPDEIAKVIDMVKQAIMAEGNGIKRPDETELKERQWRADPQDGLRPLMETRKNFIKAHG